MTTTMPPNPVCKRGDVVLVLFPNSNLTSVKPRPALVVQADRLQTGLKQVIVAMSTSKTFRANHPNSNQSCDRRSADGKCRRGFAPHAWSLTPDKK